MFALRASVIKKHKQPKQPPKQNKKKTNVYIYIYIYIYIHNKTIQSQQTTNNTCFKLYEVNINNLRQTITTHIQKLTNNTKNKTSK